MKQPMPEEFKSMCTMLDLCFHEKFASFENVIEFALKWFKHHHLIIVKNYLDELLSGKYTAEELTDLWNSTPTRVAIFDGTDRSVKEPGIVYFLKLMRSMIEQKLTEGG